MSEVFQLINLVVDTLKHIEFYGVSLWFAVQTYIFVQGMFIVVNFFISRLGGSGE